MTGQNLNLKVAVASEKGKREENQDWMSWTQTSWGELFIVADGMGGYKGGARAAQMTVEGIEKRLISVSAEVPFAQALKDAVRETNAEVHQESSSGNPETEKMGSTVVVALISKGQVQVGHVGDSRAYLLRKRGPFQGARLLRLTKDHTNVQQMLDAKMITPKQARDHPDAHILSRAVGSKPEVEIEVGERKDLLPGDALLLCSDGLCGFVDDGKIKKVLEKSSDLQSVPQALVDLALDSGGSDNITVQFVRMGGARETAILPRTTHARSRLPLLAMASMALILLSVPLWPTISRMLQPVNEGKGGAPFGTAGGGSDNRGGTNPNNGPDSSRGNGGNGTGERGPDAGDPTPPDNSTGERSGGTHADAPATPTNPPRLLSFTADPLKVWRGQKSTLRWQTENASSLKIAGLKDFNPQGSTEVTPTESITYTAQAQKGDLSSEPRMVSVEVEPDPAGEPLTVVILVTDESQDKDSLKRDIEGLSLGWKLKVIVSQAQISDLVAGELRELEKLPQRTWILYTESILDFPSRNVGRALSKRPLFAELDKRTAKYGVIRPNLKAFVEQQLPEPKRHILLIVQPTPIVPPPPIVPPTPDETK